MSRRIHVLISLALLIASWIAASDAAEPTAGHLLAIGGGLRVDNSAVHQRLLAYAGGRERARFGFLTMAGATRSSAVQLSLTLREMGVSEDRLQIIDLTSANAAENAFDPRIVEQIRRCTALYFTGGDQRRIVKSLVDPDGTERPALKAIREVYEKGGVIAGSSAGAAMQGDPIIAVSGLPDDALDEGMDALDFGLTSNTASRGLSVTRGLGLFRAGLIDQHFNQFRGRLARLARAAVEKRIRYGFGIDENTAMDVGPDGVIEVVGAGCVTIVDTKGASCDDGPLGCSISGVRLSSLEDGDRFDPRTGEAKLAPGKAPIKVGEESNNGNHLITDIAGEGAVYYALISGLADNARPRQVGMTLLYHGSYGHGYRFTFAKTEETRSYVGYVNRSWCYAVVNVRLDIEPIVSTLHSPKAALPVDIPEGETRTACEAAAFRGLLLADAERKFRPDEPISRGDLAAAIVRTIHLLPPRRSTPLSDVPTSSPLLDDVEKVVAAGLMETDAKDAFRPNDPITRQEAATTLVRVYEKSHAELLKNDPLELSDLKSVHADFRKPVFAAIRSCVLTADDNQFRPEAPLSREETAAALCRVLAFPWLPAGRQQE